MKIRFVRKSLMLTALMLAAILLCTCMPFSSAESENSVLVVYFSCTGTTERLAKYAADLLHADLFMIEPAQPYTDADLAYYTNCRADREQNDPSARPEIANVVEDISRYDTILLGYPIWHGQAPRILSTFLESYGFDGKTIVPFCTSGSSGIGLSAVNLHDLCPDTVTWVEGQRFGADTDADEIANWLTGLGILK